MSLSITKSKGFSMIFGNGVTVSIQFGPGNYCEKHDSINEPSAYRIWKSSDAEVAAWRVKDENWCTQEIFPNIDDDVLGYLNANQVLDFMVMASKLT